MKKLPSFKVVILGENRVGKTNICLRVADLKEKSRYSIGANFFTYEREINEELITLNIRDYHIPPRFISVLGKILRGAQGGILVFDLTNPESLAKIPFWLNILINAAGFIPIILIGNKNDLKTERRISTKAVTTLTHLLDVPFFETSGLTGENIEAALHHLISMIRFPLDLDTENPQTNPWMLTTHTYCPYCGTQILIQYEQEKTSTVCLHCANLVYISEE